MSGFLTPFLSFYLRRAHRPAYASAAALQAAIAAARRVEDPRPPPKVVGGLQVSRRELAGVTVYELGLKGAAGTPILYLHGGAFCFQINRLHWPLIVELAVATGRRLVVPIMPLAPETGAEELLAGLWALWGQLAAEGPAPAVVGDSSGANLALVLSQWAAGQGGVRPAALGLLSPWLDLTLSHPDLPAQAARDPWLAVEGLREAARLYARDLPLTDWRLSPGRGDLAALPPTLLMVGGRELGLPEARDMAVAAGRAGRRLELVVGRGQVHLWPLLPIPGARAARARLIGFLQEAMGPPPRA